MNKPTPTISDIIARYAEKPAVTQQRLFPQLFRELITLRFGNITLFAEAIDVVRSAISRIVNDKEPMAETILFRILGDDNNYFDLDDEQKEFFVRAANIKNITSLRDLNRSANGVVEAIVARGKLEKTVTVGTTLSAVAKTIRYGPDEEGKPVYKKAGVEKLVDDINATTQSTPEFRQKLLLLFCSEGPNQQTETQQVVEVYLVENGILTAENAASLHGMRFLKKPRKVDFHSALDALIDDPDTPKTSAISPAVHKHIVRWRRTLEKPTIAGVRRVLSDIDQAIVAADTPTRQALAKHRANLYKASGYSHAVLFLSVPEVLENLDEDTPFTELLFTVMYSRNVDLDTESLAPHCGKSAGLVAKYLRGKVFNLETARAIVDACFTVAFAERSVEESYRELYGDQWEQKRAEHTQKVDAILVTTEEAKTACDLNILRSDQQRRELRAAIIEDAEAFLASPGWELNTTKLFQMLFSVSKYDSPDLFAAESGIDRELVYELLAGKRTINHQCLYKLVGGDNNPLDLDEHQKSVLAHAARFNYALLDADVNSIAESTSEQVLPVHLADTLKLIRQSIPVDKTKNYQERGLTIPELAQEISTKYHTEFNVANVATTENKNKKLPDRNIDTVVAYYQKVHGLTDENAKRLLDLPREPVTYKNAFTHALADTIAGAGLNPYRFGAGSSSFSTSFVSDLIKGKMENPNKRKVRAIIERANEFSLEDGVDIHAHHIARLRATALEVGYRDLYASVIELFEQLDPASIRFHQFAQNLLDAPEAYISREKVCGVLSITKRRYSDHMVGRSLDDQTAKDMVHTITENAFANDRERFYREAFGDDRWAAKIEEHEAKLDTLIVHTKEKIKEDKRLAKDAPWALRVVDRDLAQGHSGITPAA